VWKQLADFRHYGERQRTEFTFKQRVTFAAASAATRMLLRMWTDTCRWDVGDARLRDDLLQGRTQAIFLMWHNRMPAFFPWIESLSRRDPSFRLCSIISGSHDGEFLARPIRETGGGIVRGSSTHDALAALRVAVAAAQAGSNVATVGDGPVGPRYRLKPGPVLLSKAAGLPVIPVTWACDRVFQLHRSWDQLMLPLPRSRIEFRFGKPHQVTPDAGAREIATARRALEHDLNELTAWADAETRIAIQFPKPKPGETLKRKRKVELAGRHFV
jgi:lysophospholipid acyltransferase (LPLAT)-like uncharacterized protein